MATKVNRNYATLTPAQKAELKVTEARVIAQARLNAANQAKAAATTAAYAKGLSGSITSMGMAARAGGKVIDTSEASGNQNVGFAQANNLIKDMISDPFIAMRKASLRNNKMYNNPYFKRKFGNALINDAASLNKYNQASGGSGSSLAGYETIGARPTIQPILA